MEPNNIILVGWVNQDINQSLTKRNIKVGFMTTNIWPFNPKVMDNKIQSSKIYITASINNHGSDKEEYTLDEKFDYNQGQQLREEFATVELFHETKTSIHQTTPKDHPTNKLEFDQCYYVDMFQSLTMIEE